MEPLIPPTFVFLVVLSLIATTGAFCPKRCNCTDSPLPTVDCAGAGLTSIPITLNPRIRSLNLRNNRISSVPVDELSIYPELEFLDMSFNRILSLDRSAFYRLTDLRVLKINGNQIESLKIETFSGLQNLKILDLSKNRQSRIATSVFANLRRLEVLNLSDNLIKSVSPGAFTGLTSLTALHMTQNQLAKIETVAFRAPTALKLINLDYNNLKQLPNESFARLQNLEVLNLANNGIEAIGINAFVGLRSLLHLDLTFNKLYRVPTLSFRPLTELNVLHIGGNLFSSFPTSSFEGLQSLQQLIVEQCAHLRSVDLNAFSGLRSLQTLILARNPELASIHPIAFESPNAVRRVFLNDNALTSLPDILLNWSKIETLDLRGNPWNCDCDFRWMSRVFADHQESLIPHTVTCASPEAIEGVPLQDFESRLSGCTGVTSDQTQLILTIAVVAGCLFAVTVGLLILFRCRKRIRAHFPTAKREPLYARSDVLYSSDCGTTGFNSKKSLLYAGFSPAATAHSQYQGQFYGDPSRSPDYLYHSIPSSRTTTLSVDGGSFRVIKDYPVPITEL